MEARVPKAVEGRCRMTLPRLTEWALTAHVIAAIRTLQQAPPPTDDERAAFAAWEEDWNRRLAEAMTALHQEMTAANNMARLAVNKQVVDAAKAKVEAAQATFMDAREGLNAELGETLNAALVAGLVDASYFEAKPPTEGPVV